MGAEQAGIAIRWRWLPAALLAFTMQAATAQEPAAPSPENQAPQNNTPAPKTPADQKPPDTRPPADPATPVTPTTTSVAPAADDPGPVASAHDPSTPLLPSPIAIVPMEGVLLTGAVDLADGKAVITHGGSIEARDHSATITLPRRGNLRICPTTKVNLTEDATLPTALPAGETPGLMMALDRGALEANFSTGKNSDVILTPDFRIVISGPGLSAVQVRLGDKGDTCVDNKGADAPYVTVSSVFEGGVYRVQPEQRVMFQHGSLNEVVDREKETCGCPPDVPPPPVSKTGNEFPLAQSQGMAPLPVPPPNATQKGVVEAQATAKLAYDGTRPGQIQAEVKSADHVTVPAPAPAAQNSPNAPAQKKGFFRSIGHFFKKLFGG